MSIAFRPLEEQLFLFREGHFRIQNIHGGGRITFLERDDEEFQPVDISGEYGSAMMAYLTGSCPTVAEIKREFQLAKNPKKRHMLEDLLFRTAYDYARRNTIGANDAHLQIYMPYVEFMKQQDLLAAQFTGWELHIPRALKETRLPRPTWQEYPFSLQTTFAWYVLDWATIKEGIFC